MADCRFGEDELYWEFEDTTARGTAGSGTQLRIRCWAEDPPLPKRAKGGHRMKKRHGLPKTVKPWHPAVIVVLSGLLIEGIELGEREGFDVFVAGLLDESCEDRASGVWIIEVLSVDSGAEDADDITFFVVWVVFDERLVGVEGFLSLTG